MSTHSYEIEIKSLLGGKDRADDLKEKMKADPSFREIGAHKQLNHYFTGGELGKLHNNVKSHLAIADEASLKSLIEKVSSSAVGSRSSEGKKDLSVRTRWADGKVILVIKASVDDTSSSNGTARLEWEAVLNDFELDKLDDLVLKSGFEYQAKWSREREEFKYQGANVSIDKNAGYGYVSEFEMVIDDPAKADETKALLRQMMTNLGVNELPQDRLARMFNFYNKNWVDYYGTEKIFNID